MPLATFGSEKPTQSTQIDPKGRNAKLDEILKQPVLKKELFPDPVIIETVELLRYERSFLCRVRSKDGAEGISMGHGGLTQLYSIFLTRVQPYFIGQDARELDLLLEGVITYSLNFRYNGLALNIPLSAIEFAILDMLGRIANKPTQELIGKLTTPEVPILHRN